MIQILETTKLRSTFSPKNINKRCTSQFRVFRAFSGLTNLNANFSLSGSLTCLYLYIILCCLVFGCSSNSQDQNTLSTDVLIIGGGASGTTAAIQAARMGVSVTILEETPWLGGMLTSAGVSAIDGNYNLHSGLWEEFRNKLYENYGGADSVKTGWVSNVLFEPQVGDRILKEIVEREKNIQVFYESKLQKIDKVADLWGIKFAYKNSIQTIRSKMVIDATELGDVAKMVGVSYDVGMESRNDTGEEIAPEEANDIVQDLTYVAILKDFGEGADKTISKPANYDPTPFLCTCAGKCDADSLGRTLWDCGQMMQYGRLPNDYYMINWPINGNDYYLNLIDLTPEEREAALQKAKDYTLSYVYYLQTALGFKHLGIADDIYPTDDNLPFIPYHRESRRIHGLVRFTVNDVAKPFDQEDALYRTGIAVGDYPVDHHHHAYPEVAQLPDLHFYPVPSYALPLGTLIPQEVEDFIVAEKSISVSNLVNGATRLQPVCLLIGQAAGTLAALAVQQGKTPKEVSIREVQGALLASKAYLLPYLDIKPEHPAFEALQRIGATGILRGEGKNIGWSNQTLIYPDSILTKNALEIGLDSWLETEKIVGEKERLLFSEVLDNIRLIGREYNLPPGNWELSQLYAQGSDLLKDRGLEAPKMDKTVSRAVFAVLLDTWINPFYLRDVDHDGEYK